jgi:aspartate aminotransferase
MRADFDSLGREITERTRMVVINSPGNPLGNVIDRNELRRFDDVVAGRAVLISDEMYGNVLFDDEPYSALQLADVLRSPLIVTDGFSKGHRMYARRVGYAVVPDSLVEPLAVVQHHTLLTTDPVSQFGAIAALDHPEGVARLTDRYRERRDTTLRKLATIPGVRPLPARGGFYLTLDCAGYLGRLGEADSMPLARRILDRVRVATVPGADFGLPLTLRLSFSAERYDEAVDRLAGFFADS